MREFGLISFKTKNWIWIILKKDYGIYLCCRNYGCYSSTVGREERQLQVVAREELLMNPTMCCLYWNEEKQECRWMRWWWIMDAMPLRDFLLQWWDGCIWLQMVMNDELVCCLTCFLFTQTSHQPLLVGYPAFSSWDVLCLLAVLFVIRSASLVG